jgi:peptide/nickel transport system substrate-binding protein
MGNFTPVLAESWEADPDALTFTWHLREGIEFHDGTPWNAEALRWNFQIGIDNGTLSDAASIDSLEVLDDYTLIMHLNSFNWWMFENWGVLSPISPTAYESSGATEEERIAWARENAVGTGPYTVDEWQRDDHIRFVKNDNYWQPGLPYLDAIEIRYIPDPMVAATMMEAGEADIWFSVSSVQDILDLQEQGLKINWGPGMFQTILYNSNDPNSPFADKRLREAVEYAINRTVLAEMLGQGLYEPLYQMASSTSPGYVEYYNPRLYDPDKARQLLAEAGFPYGFDTTLLITEAGIDAGSVIKAYLAEVGIEVELDVADLDRYFGSVFKTGWAGMVYTASGINPSATDIFVHYGPSPMTFRTGNIWKSPEYLALCTEALDPTKYNSIVAALPKIKEAVRQAGEDAMILPIFRTAECAIMQTYVHTDYPLIHGIIWTPQDDWMEEH